MHLDVKTSTYHTGRNKYEKKEEAVILVSDSWEITVMEDTHGDPLFIFEVLYNDMDTNYYKVRLKDLDKVLKYGIEKFESIEPGEEVEEGT